MIRAGCGLSGLVVLLLLELCCVENLASVLLAQHGPLTVVRRRLSLLWDDATRAAMLLAR